MQSTQQPGPKSFLGLRSLRQFRKSPMTYLKDLADEHGDAAFFKLGPIQAVLLNHPDLIREVLVRHREDFPKMGRQRKVIRQIDGNSLFVKQGKEWMDDRRMIQSLFAPEQVASLCKELVASTQQRLESWQDSKVLNFEDEMIELSIELMGRMFFGVDLTAEAASLRKLVYVRSDLFLKEMSAVVPLPDQWPLPSKIKKRKLKQQMDELIYGIIRRRRAEGLKQDDFVSTLLRNLDQRLPANEADRQVRDHANMMFQAGADDVSTALAWMFYLVAKHPEVQRALVAESVNTRGQIRAFNPDSLSFTECVVRESLRLYPSTWLFTARKARRDIDLGRFVIRHKTWVFISPYITQRDTQFFKNPNEFRPERFRADSMTSQSRQAFFPFGVGPKACAAGNFSIKMMSLIATNVLQRFELNLEPGQDNIEPSSSVTLRPNVGIQLRVKEREVAQIRRAA